MNHVLLRQRVLTELALLAEEGHVAVEIAQLARRVDAPATKTALVAASLLHHGHAIGDGDMMGFVGITEAGRSHLAAARELAPQEPMGEFAVRDDDARKLFDWIVERFERSGDLMARWPGERRVTVEYAALRVPSGEVGIMVLSQTEEHGSPRYAGLAVGWTRDIAWDEEYRWRGLRPTDSLLSLNQYATFDEALAAIHER